ncbi:MAG: hypothetical protein PHX68_03340 [Alphaproteobacteria bacterium]|nr:hypothetical protein [Alphaproteobacteria bacterium]
MSIYHKKKTPAIRWIVAALVAGLLVFVAVKEFRPAVTPVEKTIPYMAP